MSKGPVRHELLPGQAGRHDPGRRLHVARGAESRRRGTAARL